MFNINNHKNKIPQYKVIINPIKIQQYIINKKNR